MKKINLNPLSKALVVGAVIGALIWLGSCAIPVPIPLSKDDAPKVIVIEEPELVRNG